MWLGVTIFAFTYLLISARRLGWLPIGRPGGALLGAVVCVAAGVLGAEEALAAVDGHTILLLFGMMGMGAFLAAEGFFERAGERLAARARTRARLLAALVWSSGGLAALITNDAVCVLGAPLVVGLIQRYRLPPLPFLLGLATSANTGSVATLVGNPQNMLCASLGGLSYREHLLVMLPVALAGLAINHALLWWFFRRQLRGPLAPDPSADSAQSVPLTAPNPSQPLWTPRTLVALGGILGVGGEGGEGWWRLSGLFLLGSNIVSNVPFILVVREPMASLPDPRLGWEMLAMASTFAGNLTLVGSVANIIVAEKGREVGGIGFWEYLRVGAPLAILTTALGTAWLLLVM